MCSKRNSHSFLVGMPNGVVSLEDSCMVSYSCTIYETIRALTMVQQLFLIFKLKTYVYTKTCKRMFMATLFIIAKTWKESKCPSVWHSGKDKTMEKIKRSLAARDLSLAREMNRQSIEAFFLGQKKDFIWYYDDGLYIIGHMHFGHYTFDQTYRMYNIILLF